MEFESHSEMFNLINEGMEKYNIFTIDDELEDLHEKYHKSEELLE